MPAGVMLARVVLAKVVLVGVIVNRVNKVSSLLKRLNVLKGFFFR